MTTYARIVSGQAVDVTTSTPADIFHTDVASQFVVVPDGTSNGDLFDGTTWKKVAADTTPAPVTQVFELLTPMTFYMAFTPTERIAIKESKDPVVVEFWSTFELSVQMMTMTNPNLASVQDGLNYLVSQSLLTADRVPDILRGVPK